MRKSSLLAKKLSDDSIDEDGEYEEKFEEEFDLDGDVKRVANLTFVDGELGRGSYGSVRLAKRKVERIEKEKQQPSSFFPPMTLSPFRTPRTPTTNNNLHDSDDGIGSSESRQENRRRNQHLSRSMSEPASSGFFEGTNANKNGKRSNKSTPKTPLVVGRLGLLVRNLSGESARGSFYADKYSEDDDEELVAVKIFRKSILKKMRTMERSQGSRRMLVKTALMKVETEIAIMKKLCHPNLIQLYDVLDSPESDMLYMVLEYMPLGEILTWVEEDRIFRRKEPKNEDDEIPGIVDGHFNEEAAALFFVDILHGLAYLHDHSICHRDLKPENILLSRSPDGFPVAKLSDFGVSHMFEEEEPSESSRSTSPEPRPKRNDRTPTGLTKHHVERALSMSKKSDSGLLTKTEGSWPFWSPDMCKGGAAFSGYAADIWAAGICLYIFVSGRLPFYSESPLDLMEAIAEGEVPYDNLDVSYACLGLLKIALCKDPRERAGVGDCLQHPFLADARTARVTQLSEELIRSHEEIVVGDEDLRAAFQIVTRIPSVLIKSAAKQVEVAGKRLARLTKAASNSFHSDQSPVSTRSINKKVESSFLSDTSDTTNSNHGQPTSLPVISSNSEGNMDDDNVDDIRSEEGQVPTAQNQQDTEEREECRDRRKKLFSSIFRRGKGHSHAHKLESKNTC